MTFITWFKTLFGDDRGIGMVTALSVSFVVLGLGATWYTISVHELEEVSFDEHRTLAVNMADAGLRVAMERLATEETFRDDAKTSGGATAGTTSGACDLAAVNSDVDGIPRQLGEYWYRAEKVDPSNPNDRTYLVESWGWASGQDARQPVVRHAEIQVELIPDGGGFNYALFASEGGLTAGNRKEIYGDIYSGDDLVLDNYTRVYPNDDGYPGTGSIRVYRDLTISSGSNVEAWGEVKVNGYIDDNKSGSHYFGDVIALHDNATSSFTNSYFKNATVDGTFYTTGNSSSVTGNLTAGLEVYGATGIEPAPAISLPTFVWDASDYSPAGVTWASWADFDAWYSANTGALSGAHYVQDSGSYTLDMGGTYLTDDFILVFDGSLTLKKTPSGSALTPATVVLVGLDTTSVVTVAQSANSIENEVHHLIYTNGTFVASQQTTIYGAMYGYEDASTQRLEVHFRPPNNDAIKGFVFDPALADSYLPQPGVWREVPDQIDASGIVDPDGGHYCTLP